MVNLLIQKLCAFELPADKLASAEATVFIAHENDKKKSNYVKVNSSKPTIKDAYHAKETFPCNKCKQLGHWAVECPQKQQHAGDRGGKSTAKKNAHTFLVHVMRASRANSVDTDSWYCDNSATQHITPNEQYFLSYKKFTNPETIMPGKKNVLMQTYCQGMTYVHMFHNGVFHDTILKDILYVPDASAHLFPIKAAAQNSYSTTMNEKKIVNRRGDGTTAASGKLVNDLYVFVIQVCIPQHAAQVHLAT
jgi:hypothetical protein